MPLKEHLITAKVPGLRLGFGDLWLGLEQIDRTDVVDS